MDNKILAVVVVLVLVVAGVGVVVATNGNDKGDNSGDNGTTEFEPYTVKDACDRDIKISGPIDKVAIFDTGSLDIFACAVGPTWADHVCMMPADLEIREPQKAAIIYEKWPHLKQLPMAPFLFNQDGTMNLPSPEAFAAASPDLIVLDGAPLAYYPDNTFGNWMNNIGEALAPVFCTLFYMKSYEPQVCEKNYGTLGQIMGTQAQADKVTALYESTKATVSEKIGEGFVKDFLFYVELQVGYEDKNSPPPYGQIAGAGTPELDMLGGDNINNTGMHSMNWTFEQMTPKGHPTGPEWIFIVNTPYAGADPLLGYGVEDVDAEAQKIIDSFKSRDSWDTLQAVQNDKIVLYYGELRNSAFGILDLCNMAHILYPDHFDMSLSQSVLSELNDICPWGFSGTFMYQSAAA